MVASKLIKYKISYTDYKDAYERFWHQGTCVYLYLLILWHCTKLTVAHMSSYTILKSTKTVASIASKASLRGNQYYSQHYIFAIAFLLLASCTYTHAYIINKSNCEFM